MTASHHTYLIASPFFYPEPISTGKYNTYLATALAEQQAVYALCSHPLYPHWQPQYTNAELDNVHTLRGGLYLRYPSNVILRRAVLEIWYASFVFYKSFGLRKKINTVVAIFPPSLFMLSVNLLFSRQRKIGIVHDLQGVYANYKQSKFRTWLGKLIHTVEKKAFSNCDRLIFLSHTMRETAMQDYQLDPARCVVAYPFTTLEPNPPLGTTLQTLFDSSKKNIVYSGALGEKQAPEQLLQFFTALTQHNNDVVCHIFSQGSVFEQLKASTDNPNIQFHDLVAEQNLPELLQRSTVQILPQAKGTSSGSLPSKLPNIVTMQTPVFVITDAGSELVHMLQNYPLAHVATNWCIDDLVKSCNTFLANLPPKSVSYTEHQLLHQFSLNHLIELITNYE